MIKKYQNKWFSVLLAIGFLFMTNSIAWAKSEDTRTVSSKEIRESAENYLINNLDWNPESMDITVSYEAKDLVLPEGKLLLDFGMPKNYCLLFQSQFVFHRICTNLL